MIVYCDALIDQMSYLYKNGYHHFSIMSDYI